MDRAYSNFCRKIYMFLGHMSKIKMNLDETYDNFARGLKASPLTGRMNEDTIRYRGAILAGVEGQIARFEGLAISFRSIAHCN